METEIWAILNFKDIEKDRYLISTLGRIKNIKKDNLLTGNNPENEKGYVRVCLKTDTKQKKFPLHVLVCFTFKPPKVYTDKIEVNHKNGVKTDNYLDNLEWCTRKENAEHASENNLYKKCEMSHNATFSNDEVHLICEYFQKGFNVAKVAKILGFDKRQHIIVYLTRIKFRETWTEISKDYMWDLNLLQYKTYRKEDIELMCQLITNGLTNREISQKFNYDQKKLINVLKKIKERKLYKDIAKKYFIND